MLFLIVVVCCLVLRFRYNTNRFLEKIIKIATVALLFVAGMNLAVHMYYINGYGELRSEISNLEKGVSAEIAEWNKSVDSIVNIADNLWLLDVTWFLHDSEVYSELYILEDYMG